MEKVTLTKEQAREFESFKTLRSSLEEWARDKYDPNAAHSIIHKLTFDKMARAYLVGYEIENSYELGDEVVDVTSRNCPIITVTNQDEKHLYGYWGDDVRACVQKKNARLATEEEIYWKKTLRREKVRDFRIGDVLIGSDQCSYVIGRKTDVESGFLSFEEVESFLPRLGVRGIMPFESYKRLPKEESK